MHVGIKLDRIDSGDHPNGERTEDNQASKGAEKGDSCNSLEKLKWKHEKENQSSAHEIGKHREGTKSKQIDFDAIVRRPKRSVRKSSLISRS